MQKQFLIHIGYPKAASTWLQWNVFSGTDEVFAPLGGPRKKKSGFFKPGQRIFFDYAQTAGLNNCSVSPFRFDAEEVSEKIRSDAAQDEKVTCLSNETWAGHPFSSGVLAPIFADRIHRCLPEAKILIVFRNQPEMIVSSYLHLITKGGGTCTLQEFMHPSRWEQTVSFSPFYFDYSTLVSHYDGLFGEANVICLPFELITTSPMSFAEPIYRAFGATAPDHLGAALPENARPIVQAAALSRVPRINMLRGETLLGSSRMARGTYKALLTALSATSSERTARRRIEQMRAWVRSEVGDFYCTGNTWLANRTGYDLGRLGYAV